MLTNTADNQSNTDHSAHVTQTSRLTWLRKLSQYSQTQYQFHLGLCHCRSDALTGVLFSTLGVTWSQSTEILLRNVNDIGVFIGRVFVLSLKTAVTAFLGG